MTDTPMSEAEQLDVILWCCLNLWGSYVSNPYADASEKVREKLKCVNAVDWFCANVKNRLQVLKEQGEDPELFEPVLCHK